MLARTAKSEAWFPNVDLLLVDECHLSVSPAMAERVLPYYQDRAQIVGLTATPARKSGRGLGSFYTEIKHVTSVKRLIEEGHLCPLEYWAGKAVDVKGVKTQGGDWQAKELSKRSMPLIGDVLDNWLRLASDRHTLVFACDIPHAMALTERFQQAGISAAAIHNKMTADKRHAVVEGFRDRRIQVLVNVMIASYGFDVPTIDCIVAARGTKSEVLHLQMLGRGMRTAPGKEHCLVLDHGDNVRRLGMAEDPFRWRLDDKKRAVGNWARHEANPDRETEEDKLTECEECHHLFAHSRICPKCGWEKPLKVRDVETIEADLVRIDRKKADIAVKGMPPALTVYRMLCGHALARGYSSKWAAVNYRKLYGAWPPWDYSEYGPLNPSPILKNWIVRQQNEWRRRKAEQERRAGAVAG